MISVGDLSKLYFVQKRFRVAEASPANSGGVHEIPAVVSQG